MIWILFTLMPTLYILSPLRFAAVGSPGIAIPKGLADGRLPLIDYFGPKIEDIQPYQPQTTCDPPPKPGVVAFRNMILKIFPQTGDDGISRACGFSPDGITISEHYEGRAWDWRVSVNNPDDVKRVQAVIDWLFARDKYGHDYAMARRLGVMYIIWDRQIWGLYRASDGWRPYTIGDPHTGHVHFSFYWYGALEQATFWYPEQSCAPPATPTIISACTHQ
jgi:hypothetical protein